MISLQSIIWQTRKTWLLYLPSVHTGGDMLLYLCPRSLSVPSMCPFISVLRLTVLPKGCMCSLVNQVYRPTSLSLATLRSTLPVTAFPKDSICTLVKLSRYFYFAICSIACHSPSKRRFMHTCEISRYFHLNVCSSAPRWMCTHSSNMK